MPYCTLFWSCNEFIIWFLWLYEYQQTIWDTTDRDYWNTTNSWKYPTSVSSFQDYLASNIYTGHSHFIIRWTLLSFSKTFCIHVRVYHFRCKCGLFVYMTWRTESNKSSNSSSFTDSRVFPRSFIYQSVHLTPLQCKRFHLPGLDLLLLLEDQYQVDLVAI